jgi:predicted amidophosphoribosyltransferase
VLDKHSLHSEFLGHDAQGHARYNTTRTEVGEATYQLKFRHDWNQIDQLAQALAEYIFPKFPNVGLIVPMPASTVRARQPVTELAQALGAIVRVPVFDELLIKGPNNNGAHLKDLNTKEEKLNAIGDSFHVADGIQGEGPWNALLLDDLFHTGASMEKACEALMQYRKINHVYVAALTWRP